MSRTLVLRNRQRVRSVDTPLLRRITRHLLSAHFQLTEFELGLTDRHFVASAIQPHHSAHEGSDSPAFDLPTDERRVAGAPPGRATGRPDPA